jgi:hypothetical protein
MAVIYLRHPNHGAKVAISEMEAENDMQNGWEEFDPTVAVSESLSAAIASAPADVAVVKDEPTEVVNELQPRRRGRRAVEATQ